MTATIATAGPITPAAPPLLLAEEEKEVHSLTSGLRTRVLLLLGVALLIALVVGAAQLLLAQRQHQEHEAAEDAVALRRILQHLAHSDVQEMRSMTTLLMMAPRLEAAYRAGDRDALLEIAAPMLQSLEAHSRISYLSFIRPDRTVLLHVHAPGQPGGRMDGDVLRDAQQIGHTSWGYEQGADGGLILRTVSPWIVNDKLIGYMDMGIRFEQLLLAVKRTLGGEVVVTLDKSRLERQQWEAGQGGNAEAMPWGTFPERVVLSRTLDRLPADLVDFLSRPGPALGDAMLRMREDGRILHARETPLRDAKGSTAGWVLIFKDRTDEVHEQLNAVWTSIGLRAAGGALMLLFLYVLLGRMQRRLADGTARLGLARQVIATEQQERQRAERELAMQQERNELLEARNRMVDELAEAKRVAETALRKNEEVTAKLVEAQSELMASAREAGRAEIATNVLHNVGNVLNSVNISAGVIGSALRNSRLSGLARAMELMTRNAGNLGEYLTRDEKGRMLPGYLAAAVKAMDQERQALLEELERLTKSIDHIKDIVATQQAHAAAGQVVEPVQPSELADEALRMQGSALARHQVEVVRDYEDMGPVPLDRSRVLQILVNLISNAKAAMSAQPTDHPPRITVGVRQVDGKLRFTVRDEGEGIPPENLTRIFSHGFTTRKSGHGFGLHSSALAARDLGGALCAASEGVGRGATFTLDLPVAPARASTRAAGVVAG